MKFNLYIYIWAFCLTVAACRNEGTRHSYTQKNNTRAGLIFSYYLAILTEKCGSECREMEDLDYSQDNTHFYLLSEKDKDTLFASASELECWCMAGSCGSDIHIFSKNKEGVKELFHGCGFIGQVEDTFINGMKPFAYTVRGYESGNLKIRVTKNKDSFHFDTLQRGDIPYEVLQLVLKNDTNCTHHHYDCPESQIEIDTFPMSENGDKMWIVKNALHNYWLIEMQGKKQIINHFEEVMQLELQNTSTNGKKDIVIHKPLTNQVWKWDKIAYKLISEKENP